MEEFNWLGYCVSCNVDCCHNMDKSIPENECIKPGTREIYTGNTRDSNNAKSGIKKTTQELPDYRPLECRLFPFDIKEINEKLTWVMWHNCHATPKLEYEKFIGYFERHFSRAVSADQIRQYIANQKLNELEKNVTKEFKVIREVKWNIE
jgi:hypothetical protein